MASGTFASKKKRESFWNWIATVIVLFVALLVILPIWWIFRTSVMSVAAVNSYPPEFIPHEWLWSNYSKALQTFEYWTYFRNTFSIIIPAVTFGTITAIFCGYAFARLRFPREKADL
jgi:multiple sugar transport system permease protein